MTMIQLSHSALNTVQSPLSGEPRRFATVPLLQRFVANRLAHPVQAYQTNTLSCSFLSRRAPVQCQWDKGSGLLEGKRDLVHPRWREISWAETRLKRRQRQKNMPGDDVEGVTSSASLCSASPCSASPCPASLCSASPCSASPCPASPCSASLCSAQLISFLSIKRDQYYI